MIYQYVCYYVWGAIPHICESSLAEEKETQEPKYVANYLRVYFGRTRK